MRKIVLPLVLLAAFALFVGAAAAQETEAVSAVGGTLVGDRGGAHMEWTAAVPQNTDVQLTVTYSPCGSPDGVTLMVYSDDGQVTKANPDGHCTKTAYWNTAGSTSANIKLSNYLHGIALNYILASKGFTLEGAEMVSDTATVKAEMDEADAAMAAEETAETEAMEAEVMETLQANASTGEVLGTNGGGHSKYDVDLDAGGTYAALMTYNMDVGGTWPSVGFNVWGPGGSVVASGVKQQHGNNYAVNFSAPTDGTYTVDVYNYHPGRMMYYTITGMPVPAAEAE